MAGYRRRNINNGATSRLNHLRDGAFAGQGRVDTPARETIGTEGVIVTPVLSTRAPTDAQFMQVCLVHLLVGTISLRLS